MSGFTGPPVAASKDVEKLPPGITRNNLILNIAFEWAARDPSATMGSVNSLPDGRDKDEALAGIAESWANRDPQAACTFALSLPPGKCVRKRVRWPPPVGLDKTHAKPPRGSGTAVTREFASVA